MDARGPTPSAGGTSNSGFTLLEVMIAVAILAVSMTGLYSAQMANINATVYARDVTAVAFLAEYIVVDVEYQMQKEGGWVPQDKTFDGDFSEEGWPDIRYSCLIDFIEMPEYSQLREAKDASEQDTDGRSGTQYQDAGDQMFSALGVVWPMVKNAIEQSIRKVTCTIYWTTGGRGEELKIETYWTDPAKLTAVPQMGGEDLGEDQTDDGGGGSVGLGGPGPSGGGSAPGGGSRPSTGSSKSPSFGMESKTK